MLSSNEALKELINMIIIVIIKNSASIIVDRYSQLFAQLCEGWGLTL